MLAVSESDSGWANAAGFGGGMGGSTCMHASRRVPQRPSDGRQPSITVMRRCATQPEG
jgi:hypothetical protein